MTHFHCSELLQKLSSKSSVSTPSQAISDVIGLTLHSTEYISTLLTRQINKVRFNVRKIRSVPSQSQYLSKPWTLKDVKTILTLQKENAHLEKREADLSTGLKAASNQLRVTDGTKGQDREKEVE